MQKYFPEPLSAVNTTLFAATTWITVCPANGVPVAVREEGLGGGDAVPQVRLRRPVLRPGPGAEEGRKSDGDQDADDQNDHHQLDEGEALVLLPSLPETLEHGVTSLSLLHAHPDDAHLRGVSVSRTRGFTFQGGVWGE